MASTLLSGCLAARRLDDAVEHVTRPAQIAHRLIDPGAFLGELFHQERRRPGVGVPSTSWMHGSSSPIVSPIREEFLYGRTAEGYSDYPNRTAAELVRD
ncbi:hypothetical protein [Nocardia sp. NPDC004260]